MLSIRFLVWNLFYVLKILMGFFNGLVVKNLPANAGDVGSITGSEDPLEKEMIIHSSVLARKIPWTEVPGRLQSMGLQKSQAQFSH